MGSCECFCVHVGVSVCLFIRVRDCVYALID